MIQLFIPQFFTPLFNQYVRMHESDATYIASNVHIHDLWMCATAHLPIGFARFRSVKTGVEAMAGFGDFTFSTLRIEADDTPAYEKWLEGNAINPLTVLENFSGDGFKVSVTYVIDQNSFCVTIVGTKDTKKHERQGMSTWSDDLGEALGMAWYKHYIMCDGLEWPTKNRGGRWG